MEKLFLNIPFMKNIWTYNGGSSFTFIEMGAQLVQVEVPKTFKYNISTQISSNLPLESFYAIKVFFMSLSKSCYIKA